MAVFVNGRGWMPADSQYDWQAIEAALTKAWLSAGWYGNELTRMVRMEMVGLRAKR